MLIAALKRRWPISTAVLAGLVYMFNQYDIRGLDGLRLEPRADQIGAENALGYGGAALGIPGTSSQGLGWPASFPAGPKLPPAAGSGYGHTQDTGAAIGMPGTYAPAIPGGTNGTAALPSTSAAGGALGSAALQGAVPLPAGASADWHHMLSVGEKLGMLEQAQSRSAQGTPAVKASAGSGADASDTIRIASFNLHGFSDARLGDVVAVGILTRLLSQFDVIAIQNIRSRRDDVLPNLVSTLNANGRQYDFMIGPRVGRSEQFEQFAFLFDTQRIETDRFQLYTVDDPEDMLHREPLVGWFRTIGPASQDAFTFSLVNMHLDPDLVQRELQVLPSLLQAVAGDGRGEDDIILAGDFNASAAQLEPLSASGLRVVLDGVATNTRGTALLDNFAFSTVSTTEYTGRTGAYDFLRQFNLSLEQALTVSEHLPIWAEFSIIEGGRPGQVAGNALPVQRFQNDYH